MLLLSARPLPSLTPLLSRMPLSVIPLIRLTLFWLKAQVFLRSTLTTKGGKQAEKNQSLNWTMKGPIRLRRQIGRPQLFSTSFPDAPEHSKIPIRLPSEPKLHKRLHFSVPLLLKRLWASRVPLAAPVAALSKAQNWLAIQKVQTRPRTLSLHSVKSHPTLKSSAPHARDQKGPFPQLFRGFSTFHAEKCV